MDILTSTHDTLRIAIGVTLIGGMLIALNIATIRKIIWQGRGRHFRGLAIRRRAWAGRAGAGLHTSFSIDSIMYGAGLTSGSLTIGQDRSGMWTLRRVRRPFGFTGMLPRWLR